MDAHGGGRGRRRERAHDLEVAAPLSGRGRAGTARSLLGSLACSAADQRAADRADRGAPSLADDRRRDRGSAFDAALDGVGDLDSDRARQAVAARAARAAQPLRETASRRARPRRRQETGPDRASRAPRYRPGLRAGSAPPRLQPRLGVRTCGDRRRDPPRLRRSPRRREGHEPTEKPSASSAHCSQDGPTAPSTETATNDAEHSPAGSTTTLADDPTAASAAKPRSSAYTRSTGTTSSGPTTSSITDT